MNESNKSADDILTEANSIPRPIKVPSVVIGYFADLITNSALIMVNDSVLEHLSSRKDPKDTASVRSPT
jgi:ADP-heptose:LPS heptosyltransferase